MARSRFGRRNFLRSAAGGAAALAAAPAAKSQAQAAQSRRAQEPTAAARQAETAIPRVEVLTTDRPGSDFMVDVLKQLGFEYVCANPGSSFRGLHESIINYGGNRDPELITCCHEESSVAMGHGYSKVEGKPLAVLLHGAVGSQHAAMAVYNAFCDRAPVFLISANLADATSRRPGVEWAHSVQDGNTLLRDFVKWDDTPASLQHFAESAVRAYQIAMTPPMMPVALVADGDLQENPHEGAWPRIPKLVLAAPPQGESGAVGEAARMLAAAQNPVIIADRAARTPAGMALLVELAETLQAPVIDQWGRMNFPSRHPLNHSARGRALVSEADVILGLEVSDFWGTINSFRDQLQRTSAPITKPGTQLIAITSNDLFLKSNYQEFQRFTDVDLAIAADAEATLPSLIEALKRRITSDRRRALEDRGAKLAAAGREAQARARADAAYAWDASPISTARLSAELWNQIKNEDWALVSSELGFVSNWPLRLWNFDKPYQFLGGSGGAGVGYGAPASVGAALAHKKHGRLTVAIQNDGDLMYAPGVLWTAAHHRIPLLSVMHNNRAYHQEVMHVQRMALRHNRDVTRAGIGTTLEDPNIDYSKIAQGMGIAGEGPISDPKDLGPALKRGVEAVRRGEPALVDVVTQPR
jgi:acetolactate synthase I/II/III large subunit